MKDERNVSVSIPDTAYSKARQAADEADMSLSEWIEDRIIADFEDDSLTSEEILEMDWDEMVTVVDEHSLDIDPADYENDAYAFAEAVIDELEIEYPSYENPGGLFWLAIAAFLGLFGWLLLRKPESSV